MSKHDRDIMRALEDARPIWTDQVDNWNNSEAADQISRRITQTESHSPVGKRKFSPLLASALVICVLVLAASVAYLSRLSSGKGNSGRTPATAHQAAGEETAVDDKLLTREEALDMLVSQVEGDVHRPFSRPAETGSASGNITDRAEALGIIKVGETEVTHLSDPVTGAELAIWMWRGFCPALDPGGVEEAPPVGFQQEVDAAIRGLRRFEVFSAAEADRLRGDFTVPRALEAAILRRIEAILASPAHDSG